MSDKDKLIKKLRNDIVQLRSRLKRIEEYLLESPNDEDYINLRNEFEDKDELYDDAVKLVRQYKKVSPPILQRGLRIGFNRTLRILKQLEEGGIIGGGKDTKPRTVLPEEKN